MKSHGLSLQTSFYGSVLPVQATLPPWRLARPRPFRVTVPARPFLQLIWYREVSRLLAGRNVTQQGRKIVAITI